MTRNLGQSNNCVQSGKSGCPRKGYFRQPGDTSRKQTIESFPEHTHVARTCTARNTTSRAVSFPIQFSVCLYRSSAYAPFFLWEQSRVKTGPSSRRSSSCCITTTFVESYKKMWRWPCLPTRFQSSTLTPIKKSLKQPFRKL